MNVLAQTEDSLKEEIVAAIVQAGLAEAEELPVIILEKPKEKQHGDFASNIAMQLARIAKKAPRAIAEDIVHHIDKSKAAIEKVEIAGPGFINFFMKSDYLGELISTILTEGETYGQSDFGQGEKVQVEFVSVNPTGDLHLGHARGAAYGDVLCNVLTATGHDVEREYYINDAGNQITSLALSIEARYVAALGKESTMPEEGYHGDDIIHISKEIIAEDGDLWLHKEATERLSYFTEYGLSALLGKIEQDLIDFRVQFDHWFSERTLYEDNQITDVLAQLDAGGYTFEKDGATWLRSTDFEDDKDRVLIKQDGGYTYLTPDIAYHQNKFDRGFDKIINVWGADHHGYIARMKAALLALGYPEDKFSVKVIQMVSLLEKGEKLRMSKRSGNAVSLRELMDEVGVDAVRYYFVTRSHDSQLDFDTALARSQSNDNPVFHVQSAHARRCTILHRAEEHDDDREADFAATLVAAEKQVDLFAMLGDFPKTLTDAAARYTPQPVAP